MSNDLKAAIKLLKEGLALLEHERSTYDIADQLGNDEFAKQLAESHFYIGFYLNELKQKLTEVQARALKA